MCQGSNTEIENIYRVGAAGDHGERMVATTVCPECHTEQAIRAGKVAPHNPLLKCVRCGSERRVRGFRGLQHFYVPCRETGQEHPTIICDDCCRKVCGKEA